MVGRFIRSTPAKHTKYQSKFYDIFNELNGLNQTINIAMRDGRFIEAHELRRVNAKKMQAFTKGKAVKRNLARIRKSVSRIWEDRIMTPEKKKDELKKLTIERTKHVKEFYDWWLENV
jgi:hypothetical protein